MIKEFAHFISEHINFVIIISGFIFAPFMFFAIDSLKHPERYDHK